MRQMKWHLFFATVVTGGTGFLLPEAAYVAEHVQVCERENHCKKKLVAGILLLKTLLTCH